MTVIPHAIRYNDNDRESEHSRDEMGTYPIKVRKKSGRADSVSGGKDYHLVMATTNDGRALFITRFGKKNAWGVGFDVQMLTVDDAQSAFIKKDKDKFQRDYTESLIDQNYICDNEKEFRKYFGDQYFYKVSKDNLEWLIPGIDTTGVRAEKSVEFVEGKKGRYHVKETPRIPLPPAVVETPEERAAENPLFGMF